MSEVLAVFARVPEAGRVKTRLVPPLSAIEAAAVYEGAMRDVFALAQRAAPDTRILYDPTAEADEYFAGMAPDLPRTPQSGVGLGDRLASTFEMLFSQGSERVAVVGTDSPTLPPDHITRGFASLQFADVAFGPAEDGGYYLVAIRREAWPRARALFERIEWSTESVLRQSLDRATDHGLASHILPGWYDVDRYDDVLRAVSEPGAEHLKRVVAGLHLSQRGTDRPRE